MGKDEFIFHETLMPNEFESVRARDVLELAVISQCISSWPFSGKKYPKEDFSAWGKVAKCG